jgi:hypothetical protein
MLYLNLTNGIEYYPQFPYAKFIRIQSTHCEQKQWDKIIRELDYDFLINTAKGEIIIVLDTSNKKKESRALYQGVPWIKYVLNRRWLGLETKVMVKGMRVDNYFSRQYQKITEKTKNKLDYCRKFVTSVTDDRIEIYTLALPGKNDGKYEYFREILGNTEREMVKHFQHDSTNRASVIR